jgi:hypothetical protein
MVNYENDKLTPNNNKASDTADKTSPGDFGAQGKCDSSTRMHALTFDPTPPLEEDEETHLAAADDQAELMR